MSRVLFLLPVVGAPRFHKRIAALQECGITARALYFSRENHFRGAELPCPGESLGIIRHRAYGARLATLLSCLPKIHREAKSADVIYAFGWDMAALGRLVSGRQHKQLVYELGDVHAMQLDKGRLGSLVRKLERWTLSGVTRVVVTAPGFASGYFNKYHHLEKNSIQVIENRLLLSPGKRPMPALYDGSHPIVIGYFGVLRCPRSWAILKKLAARSGGTIKVVARGVPMEVPVVADAKEIAGMEYRGAYTSPDDLPAMYEEVDLVWGCNSSARGSEQNWRWARTNRFYESSYFRKPMIVLKGCGDSTDVEAMGNGICIDLEDLEAATSDLLDIIPEHLRGWQKRALSIPHEVCIAGAEHQDLVDVLRHNSSKTQP